MWTWSRNPWRRGQEETASGRPRPEGRDLPDDDPDALEWPRPSVPGAPADASSEYAAMLDVRKKRVDAEIARTQARLETELEDLSAFAAAYRDLAKDSIQRSRDGAEAVVKGSAAIVTLYTGLLGLVFAADGRPLPATGVIAPFFLGAAVVLAIAYLAFLRRRDDAVADEGPPPEGVEAVVTRRAVLFMEIAKIVTGRLAWCLRAAVVSLGVGLAFLPVPFVDASEIPFAPSTSEAAEDTGAAGPDWPPPTLGPGENLQLAKILYAAQVEAAQAAAESSGSGAASEVDEAELVGWSILGGVLVIAIATAVSGASLRRKVVAGVEREFLKVPLKSRF